MDFYDAAPIMCEVVMDEGNQDDEAVDTSIASEKLDLPPIPRFDLQSEPYSYYPSFNDLVPVSSTQMAPTQILASQLMTPSIIKIANTKGPLEKRIKQTIENELASADRLIPSIIFNLPLFKRVYTAPDKTPENLETASIDEMQFYSEYFKDARRVVLFRLHCTTCDKHIGCGPPAQNLMRRHRGLNVLVCKSCYDFYGDDKFPTDKDDNTEVFCRWCGQGGKLVCCSYCPKVFCNNCVNRNFHNSYLKQIQGSDDWACFFCASKPLWALRAICRALIQYRHANPLAEDDTNCCKKKKIKTPTSSKEQKSVDKPMVVFNPDITKLCPTPRMKGSSALLKTYTPLPRAPIPIRPSPPQLRPIPTVVASPLAIAGSPKPGRSFEPRPSPSRIVNTPTTANNVAAPKTQDIHVNHTKTSCALVKLTSTTGFEHSLRIHINGDCLKIPQPVLNPNFPTKSLEHAFQIQRTTFDRLTTLNKNKFISAEEKSNSLQKILEGWKCLIGLVEKDLNFNLDIHRNNLTKRSSQAKSNENQMRWDFPTKSQCVFDVDVDSDVEIIEDDSDCKINNKPNLLKRTNSGGDDPPSKIAKTEEGMSNGNDNSINSCESKNNEEADDQEGDVSNLNNKKELNSSDSAQDIPDDVDKSVETKSDVNLQAENEKIACSENNESNEDTEMEEGGQKSDIEKNLEEGEILIKTIPETVATVELNDDSNDEPAIDLKTAEAVEKADHKQSTEIPESDSFDQDKEKITNKETKHWTEDADNQCSTTKISEPDEVVSDKNSINEDPIKIDTRVDLEEISSSVNEGSENITEEARSESPKLKTLLSDLEEEDNSQPSEREIKDTVDRSDSNCGQENLKLDTDYGNSKAEDKSKDRISVSTIDEPPQDDADIIKLLDGEISKLERTSHSLDNLSDGSNESSMRFDQTLLDEIDNVG